MFFGEDCNGDKILNRMPTTKNTSEAGSSKAQRYRPASEFDDATLAEKREYWRTKKREQRARLSEKRGRPKAANRGGKLLHSNKPVVTKSRASTSTAISSPPLFNNDGTVYSEEASRKERWFQRIKLNKVLPQFPKSSSGACVAVSKSLVSCLSTGGAPSGSVTSSKPNGALLHSGSSVPPPKAMVQHSVLAPRQTEDAMIITNGSSTTVSPRCVVVQGPSGPRALPKSQVTLRIQPKLMTANIAAGVKFVTHSAPVVVHQVIGDSEGNKSALATYQNARGRPSNHTPAKPETEEERAARRRELWRVKKREQRAKQAARLAKTREQMKHMEGASQRKSAGLAHEHRPTARDGQRLVVNRGKAPFTAAGRLLRNAKVATPSSSMPKLITIPIKKETDFSQSSDTKPSPCNLNQQSVEIKVEDPQLCKGTMLRPIPSIPVGHKTVDHSRRPHGPLMFPAVSRGMVRCRTPRQRFIEAQKSFLGQRSRSPFHSTVFTTRNPSRDNPSETLEQRAAQRREYWRVKKREQRANQSLEVKARMKERDALKRRVKRYQSILQEMRRARAAGFGTVATPTGSTLTHASETIGGFIKEDGTVTISLPQINSDLTNRSKETGACGYSLSTTSVHSTPRHPLKNTVLCSNDNRNFVLGHQVPTNPPPPPLRLAHVKVTCPPVGQSVNRPPKLFSIRPRIESQSTTKPVTNSPTLVIRTPSQITLTHPQNLQTPLTGMSTIGPNSSGCVMKMAITSSAQPLAPPHLGPELTEEERMVRKREYWRVKKREQRAARAARLKQGASQAKGNAAAKRGWIQKPPPRLAVSRVTCVKRAANITVRTPPLPSHSVSIQTHEVKQEREPSPAADLHEPAEEPICPDIKPALPPPPPGPQPEPDPALSADSQAATLLAVASMKKLLEESLSTVTECAAAHDDGEAVEQHSCKAERQACSPEEASEQEEKPNLPLLSFGDVEEEEEEEKAPIDDDLTLDVKTWRVDVDALVHLKRSSFSSEDSALLPSCSENLSDPLLDAPSHTCTPPAPSGVPTPPLPRRAQRLRDKKAGHHHCCSPEPPKLHHLPLPTQQPQQQQCKQQHQLQNKQQLQQPSPQQQQCKPQSQRPQQQQQPHNAPVASELNTMSSLQKKREYWRFMKRQQRARSKARQKDGVRPGDYSRRLALKAAQSPNLFITKSQKPVQRGGGFSRGQLSETLQPKPSVLPQPVAALVSIAQASLTTVTSIPTVLVVSPTASDIGQPPAILKVKPPIRGVSHSPQQIGVPLQSLQTSPRFSTVSLPVTTPSLGNGKEGRLLLVENQQEAAQGSRLDLPRVRKWSLQVQEAVDSDIAPIPTLTPPVNPLTSIKLLPIQPLSQPLIHTPTQIPTKISPRPQNIPSHTISPVVPVSNMVPPKPIQGESDEEFLRRKREYWRVKKKEQRARKAMKDRQLTQKRASVNWKPILPNQNQLQGLDEQDSGQWGANISEDNEHLNSSSNTDLGYYPYLSHTEPIEDESDLYFPEYKDINNEEGPISEAVWRSRYLMDQDPLNQLLVCMVCGELQYSHTLEAVQAHIEEAHPDTLNLAAPERSRILEAWDEQVSQRERFFTSQLQQHS